MPLVSGAMAAGFSIVRELGCGHIGELYLAEHPRLPRRHALEILPADVSADPEYRERFNRESDHAAALWHPHIVSLHDRGEFEGQLWLSMDYVDGADAAQLLTDIYPDGMPPDTVVEIVFAIADALDYAHDHGLLHRCVKPSNILITDRRRILLAGFGVAQRLDDINSLTQTNTTFGTVSYAAPEQLMGNSIDSRADQYALAGAAFHLLTGSPPFAHANPAVVISRHLNESPPRPGDVRPELADFDETFARALAKAAGDRFPRCQDFAEALEASHRMHPSLGDPEATAVVLAPAPSPVVERPEATAIPQDGETDAVAPTAPAVPAPRDVAALHVEADDAIALTDLPPLAEIGHLMVSPEPVVTGTTADYTPAASRRRRPMLTAGFVLATIVVVPVGLLIVMALRSTSEFQDTPTHVGTPSSVTTAAPAPPARATATRPPTIRTPAPKTTIPPTSPPPAPATIMQPASPPPAAPATIMQPASTPSPPQAVMQPASPPSPPEAVTPLITNPSSPPRTTPAAPVDSRPAVGMPCGPQQTGSTTVSNSGVPISCVGTPGGFAWESTGG
jgi:serine/threonine protein kinase, bacterial